MLDEDSAQDALELKFAIGIEASRRKFEQAQILFGGENCFGLFVEAGGGDAFDEELDDFFGGGGIERAVEGKDTAECGDGIGCECFQVRIQ